MAKLCLPGVRTCMDKVCLPCVRTCMDKLCLPWVQACLAKSGLPCFQAVWLCCVYLCLGLLCLNVFTSCYAMLSESRRSTKKFLASTVFNSTLREEYSCNSDVAILLQFLSGFLLGI